MRAKRWIPVLMAVTVAATPTWSSAGETTPPSSPGENGSSPGDMVQVTVDDPTVTAFAAFLEVPAEEAAVLLATQQDAGRIEDQLVAEFPTSYGGRWWSYEENRAKLGMTKDLEGAAAIVARSNYAEAMDIVEVEYSLSELEAASRRMGEVIADEGVDGIQAGVMTNLNSVVIALPASEERTARQMAVLERAIDDYGSMISTETLPPDWRVVPTACGIGSNEDYCSAPLRGGVGFNHAAGTCTSGFIAQSRTDTKRYVITAGHCRIGTDPSPFESRKNDGTIVNVGPWHNGNPYAPDDWAIVQIIWSYWTTDNIVFVRANPNAPYPTTRDEAYTITADSNSAAGDFVCYSGRTTNTACGTVEATGVGAGHGAVRTSYCVQPGDSGGPVYRLHTAYGINYARGNVNGICKSFYVEIRDAENALNVNVLLS